MPLEKAVDAIAELSALELDELVRRLEEEFGVSAGNPTVQVLLGKVNALRELRTSSSASPKSRHDAEVDENFRVFRSRLSDLNASNPNEYALMRSGEIVQFFPEFADAYEHGLESYEDRLFSVHHISDERAYISRAMILNS